MKIRIVSIPHYLYGRAYRPEIEVEHRFLWWTWKTWERMLEYGPDFKTEEKAKRQAEEFAKGSWISDMATFEDKK